MNKEIKNIVLSGLFIAIGVILPPILHTVNLGPVVSPMHFPVLLCGLLLGWKYGLTVGIIIPLLASLLWGNPPIVPIAIIMGVELAAYGFFSGLLYQKVKLFKNSYANLYFTLISSMVIGRFIYVLFYSLLIAFGVKGPAFIGLITSLFVVGLPGIILQVLIVPPIVLIIDNKDFE
jgi:hypothetical protein